MKLLDEADQPGESISTVARKHGVSPSVMFRWRQLRELGAMTSLKADEELVPASEMRAARAKIGSSSGCSGRRPKRQVLRALSSVWRSDWFPWPRSGGGDHESRVPRAGGVPARAGAGREGFSEQPEHEVRPTARNAAETPPTAASTVFQL